MSAPSTKQQLLSLVDDFEIVTKELFEILCAPRGQKPEDLSINQLIDLLVQKDKELQNALKTAQEQAELQEKYDALKAEVDKRDANLKQLQRSLKDAETVLTSAIYQAKKKLQSIEQANSKKISSEELIKYAHKISASNAVAAPPNWAPGDQRRPYPTEMDMRLGVLGRGVGDLNAPSQAQPSLGDTLTAGRATAQYNADQSIPTSQQHSGATSSLTWQQHSAAVDLGAASASSLSAAAGQTHHTLDTKSHTKENEDVEIMSSDSSSSSSSDD